MTKTHHTPGPWRLREYCKDTHYKKGERFAQIESDGGDHWIADALPLECEHGEADARLIASAPELLAVLKLCHSLLASAKHKGWEGDEAQQRAKAVIAKAEGEA